MSQWVQRIEEHQVMSDMTTLITAIESSQQRALELSPEAVESLDRVHRIVTHIRSVVSRVDPLLVVPAWLDNMKTGITQATTHINQFRGDGTLAHLTNANAQIESALTYTSNFHVLLATSDIDELRESSSTFRRACGQFTRNLDDEVGKTKTTATTLKEKLDELTLEVTNQKQRIDSAITSFTQTFNDAETTRAKDFATNKEKLKTDFEEGFDEWSSAAEKLREASQEAFDDLLKKIDEGYRSSLNAAEVEGKKVLASLNAHKEEAERLVGIISMTGMVGGYQRVANAERDAFVRWRIGTVGSMAVLALFAMITFYAAVSAEFQPGVFANRIFVTVTLAILAGYTAFQADRHRRAEIENRRMELELASFDPFLASLTDQERNELKKQVADRLFGRTSSEKTSSESLSPNNVFDLLKMTLENLTKGK